MAKNDQNRPKRPKTAKFPNFPNFGGWWGPSNKCIFRRVFILKPTHPPTEVLQFWPFSAFFRDFRDFPGFSGIFPDFGDFRQFSHNFPEIRHFGQILNIRNPDSPNRDPQPPTILENPGYQHSYHYIYAHPLRATK